MTKSKRTYPVTIDKEGNVAVDFKQPNTKDGWSIHFPAGMKPGPKPPKKP